VFLRDFAAQAEFQLTDPAFGAPGFQQERKVVLGCIHHASHFAVNLFCRNYLAGNCSHTSGSDKSVIKRIKRSTQTRNEDQHYEH